MCYAVWWNLFDLIFSIYSCIILYWLPTNSMKEELFNVILGDKKDYHGYAQNYTAQYFKVGI